MAHRTKRKSTFIATKQYAASYRADHPLLQGRVPVRVYREAMRRARSVDFTLSKWLGYWLELTFREHPPTEDV
jgi:hypothetical protein